MNIGRKALSLALTLLLLVSLFAGIGVPAGAAALPAYSPAGTVTELVSGGTAAAGAYSVSTAEELRALSAWVNAGNTGEGFAFYLTADIDLGGDASPWVPIGQLDGSLGDLDVKAAFFGTFDGQGHSVTGLWIGGDDYTTNSGTYNAGNGLFGQNFGLVENVFVEAEIHTYRQGGAIAGLNFGTVSACASAGSISANGGGGTRGTGGIVGSNYGTVENCWSRASVHNDYRRAGGIAGYNAAEVVDEPAHGTWNSRGDTHLSDAPADYKGSILNCFFCGYADSASQGYSGGIAASCDAGCSITNCYWAEGSSADNAGYYQEAEGATGTFTSEGLLSGSETTLLSALNSDAFVPGSGAYPVLFWDAAGAAADSYTVTLTQPEGGSLTAVCSGSPISGSAELAEGDTVTLTASAPAEGWFFRSFLAGGQVLKGSRNEDGSWTAAWTVSGTAELTARYVSMDDTALTVASQAGENGALTAVKTYSWNELCAMAGEGQTAAGYMYTHRTDGWNVVGATRYVPVEALLTDAGLTPAPEDQIVAMAEDGSPSVIPTWELLSQDLYFYPGAADTETFPTEGAAEVPAAIALEWGTGKTGATAGDKLAAAAEMAYFSGSLRFVYGSLEADYVDLANAEGTVTGNRLWSGVTTLAVRTADSGPQVSVFGEGHPLSELMQYETAKTLTHAKKGDIEVKGITVTDLLTKVAGLSQEAYASVSLTAGDGFAATLRQGEYSWDDVMLIWSGNGAGEDNLCSAVNGGGGKLWVNGVASVTGEKTTFSLNGKCLTLQELQAEPETGTGWTYSAKGSTNTVDVTGVTLKKLLETYAPELAASAVRFYALNADGSRDEGPEIRLDEVSADQIMVIWSGAGATEDSLRSAVNGGTGKQWWNGIVGCVLTEKAGEGTDPGTDPGTTPGTDPGTDPGDTEKQIVLTVSRKLGKDGSPETLREYTKEDLAALVSRNPSGWAYLFYKGSSWQAIVATELVELDTLLADAGAAGNWTGGSYLEFVCSDGVYGKSYPSYDDIREKNLFVSENGSSLVPAGLAVTWQSGELDPVTADAVAALAATAYDSGSLRFVYGMSENQFTDLKNAPAGARSPAGVLGITVVYDEEEVPEGSVGTSKDVTEESEGGKAEEKKEEKDEDKKEETQDASGEAASVPEFTDVAGHWAEESIRWAAGQGLMRGMGNGEFQPDTHLNRAMMVELLFRIAGEPEGEGHTFSDVTETNWYYASASWAGGAGLVNGVGDNAFAGKKDITREEMITLIYRYCVWARLDTDSRAELSAFADADQIHPWAKDAMEWAVAVGLVEGRPDGTVDPAGLATRAETATLLQRLTELVLNPAMETEE